MNISEQLPGWVCCQLGAREHYIIPRILNEKKQLKRLYTDIWLNPARTLPAGLPHVMPRLSGRYEKSLAPSTVVSFTTSALLFELRQQLVMSREWSRIYSRNQWFQQKVISSREFRRDCMDSPDKPVVFGYSYAALEIFKRASQYGCMTVLQQIDAGPVEEDIVAKAVLNRSDLKPHWSRAPAPYWADWHEECKLADRIIVNSQWSRDALIRAGIDNIKLVVIPLMYENKDIVDYSKHYPPAFTRERPLKVLFLGSLIIRKGIAEMLQTVLEMQDMPIEFWFVGDKAVTLVDEMKQNNQVHWIGPVSRSETGKYYQSADIFILPSLSDGFGLTQLEAMSFGLPVIASHNCGEVVQDRINGILLPEVTAEQVKQALMYCIENPDKLQQWSEHALERVNDFSPARVFPFLASLNSHGIT